MLRGVVAGVAEESRTRGIASLPLGRFAFIVFYRLYAGFIVGTLTNNATDGIFSTPTRCAAKGPLLYGLLPVSEGLGSDIRRVRIFGFSLETLSPSPQCMRTPVPL